MRDTVKRLGGDAAKINPISPADLVIDHSVQVDVFRRYFLTFLCPLQTAYPGLEIVSTNARLCIQCQAVDKLLRILCHQ